MAEKINIGQPRRITDRQSIFVQTNDVVQSVWQMFERIANRIHQEYYSKKEIDLLLRQSQGIVIPGRPSKQVSVLYTNPDQVVYTTTTESMFGGAITLPAGFFEDGRYLEVEFDLYGNADEGGAPNIGIRVSQNALDYLSGSIPIDGNCHVTIRYKRIGNNLNAACSVIPFDGVRFPYLLRGYVTTGMDILTETTVYLTAIASTTLWLTAYNTLVTCKGV